MLLASLFPSGAAKSNANAGSVSTHPLWTRGCPFALVTRATSASACASACAWAMECLTRSNSSSAPPPGAGGPPASPHLSLLAPYPSPPPSPRLPRPAHGVLSAPPPCPGAPSARLRQHPSHSRHCPRSLASSRCPSLPPQAPPSLRPRRGHWRASPHSGPRPTSALRPLLGPGRQSPPSGRPALASRQPPPFLGWPQSPRPVHAPPGEAPLCSTPTSHFRSHPLAPLGPAPQAFLARPSASHCWRRPLTPSAARAPRLDEPRFPSLSSPSLRRPPSVLRGRHHFATVARSGQLSVRAHNCLGHWLRHFDCSTAFLPVVADGRRPRRHHRRQVCAEWPSRRGRAPTGRARRRRPRGNRRWRTLAVLVAAPAPPICPPLRRAPT